MSNFLLISSMWAEIEALDGIVGEALALLLVVHQRLEVRVARMRRTA